MPIAASQDWDSPPDPDARRGSGNSRRTASHPPSANAAAVARGANHTANGVTRGVRATSKAASANRTVPTNVATSIGEIGAHTATVADNPAVTGDTTKAAAADGRLPDDGGAALDTRGGPGARNTTAISDQTGSIDDTKALMGDASGGAGGGRLGTRA